MGQRGRMPTPTKILEARGSDLGHKRDLEPLPPVQAPEPPIKLTGEALKRWDKMIPRLERLGVLSEHDGEALARYCWLWSKWVDIANEAIPEKSHASSAVFKLLSELRAMEDRFGMTPSARTRIQAKPMKDADKPMSTRGVAKKKLFERAG